MNELTADYVIVGAGTAGCVLAARLSENPAISVLLVEAGAKDRHPFIHVPAGFLRLLEHPSITWGSRTVPHSDTDGRETDLPARTRPGRIEFPSTGCCTCVPSPRTSTAGSRPAPPVGTSLPACLTSAGRKPGRTAAIPAAATGGRSKSPVWEIHRRSATP